MPPIDWIASIVAAASAFMLGAIWYSPVLFAKPWQIDTGLSDEQLNAASKARIFGISFVYCLLAALYPNLANVLIGFHSLYQLQ